MSSASGTLYLEGESIFHKMDPTIKLILLAFWTIATFMFLDLRIAFTMLLLGFIILLIAKIDVRKIAWLFWLVVVFNIINILFILVITPSYGSTISGHTTVLWHMGGYVLTDQTILYAITIAVKYLSLFPIAILFIVTTHPSRLSYSLNRVGVPYKITYALNIAFRYIPDIQREFKVITQAKEARGISIEKGEAPLFKRLSNLISTVVPLVFTSLERIEIISSSMELREFGKLKKRSWINYEKLTRRDVVTLVVVVVIFILLVIFKLHMKSRFWCPSRY